MKTEKNGVFFLLILPHLYIYNSYMGLQAGMRHDDRDIKKNTNDLSWQQISYQSSINVSEQLLLISRKYLFAFFTNVMSNFIKQQHRKTSFNIYY